MRAIALAVALLTTATPGDPTDPQRTTPEGTFAVRCGTLHVGDGTILEGATMLVVGGRITEIGSGANAPAIPEDMPVLDATKRTVIPGLVMADSDLSGHRDSDYNVTPDFLAVDGFDFETPFRTALSGGVTTVYLSPGRSRLISGQGSVVKLFGDDIEQRVIAESSCLRVQMGVAATKSPLLFEPTPEPTSDDPLKPARKQAPSARISLLTALRRTFAEATARSTSQGEGPEEDLYAVAPLRAAAAGELPLRIAAQEAADIRRALFFAGELHANLILENPNEIAIVATDANRQNAAAVFRVPVRPGASNPGGEDRDQDDAVARPEAPAQAANAGLRIAIAPPTDDALADALLVAGVAVRHGLSPAQAMRAITGDAAAILGVADRVGTLAAGKDADFVVLTGDPFAIGTMVEQTFVDGRLAFEREDESDVLAVRAGRVLTMNGPPLRDGVVIVQDGVIKAVGEDLAVPFGARVIDLGDGVLVPGFIDAHSHLGLSGEGTGIPKGAADQRVAEVVDPADPLFRSALDAGLTTVLVAGRDENTVSGRVAALKTGAVDRKSMVLKETAAIRLVHDKVSAEGIEPISEAIDKARKYIEQWQRYEKAIADFEAGKIDELPEEAIETTEEKVDPITGFWEVELRDAPFPIQVSFDLVLEGTEVSGAVIFSFRGQERPTDISEGSFVDGKLELTASSRMAGKVVATVGEDTMEGRFEGGMPLEFTAKRVAKPDASGKVAGKDDGSPKKPVVDESLEPLRALLEKRIPAVIRADKAPAIAAVVAWFQEQDLPFVLTGLDDAIETPEILGAKHPPVILDPDIIRREAGHTTNAAAVLSERGHAVAIGTGDTAGARFLPVHAALAVRYGMDPNEALRALTINAARMFRLDDRIGSIERGKDADFVVFSGNPFEMTSRVELVVVNGRVVVDERSDK